MYSIEQAIRIALLENTGLHEVAIASVIEAVKGLTAEPLDDEGERMLADLDAERTGTGYLVAGCHVSPRDVVVILGAPSGQPPVAWIIEKVGHPVSMTHYATVAESKRSSGFTVTEHHARVRA